MNLLDYINGSIEGVLQKALVAIMEKFEPSFDFCFVVHVTQTEYCTKQYSGARAWTP